MRLVGDPEAEAWLAALPAEAFEWDRGNRSKNAKHRVEPSEVESLFQRTFFLAGRIVEPTQDEPRWLARGDRRGAPPRAHLHPTRQQAPADKLPTDAARRTEGL